MAFSFDRAASNQRRKTDNHEELAGRRAVRESTADLNARIDRLTLVNEAIWSLLQEASNLTDEHLAARVKELDESDGQVDGTYKPAPSRCGECDAAIGRGRRNCLFCGASAVGNSPFRSV